MKQKQVSLSPDYFCVIVVIAAIHIPQTSYILYILCPIYIYSLSPAFWRVGVCRTAVTYKASSQSGRGLQGSVRPVLAAAAAAGASSGKAPLLGTDKQPKPANMSDEEQEQTIAEDLVVTKYKMGGDIANRK